jgi:hypothetical protein
VSAKLNGIQEVSGSIPLGSTIHPFYSVIAKGGITRRRESRDKTKS